jgi:hypothetical protein
MQNRIGRLIATLVLAVGAAVLAAGCGTSGSGEGSSVSVSLEDLPDAPRRTVQRLTAGGRIERIDRQLEEGRVVYDVEATIGGKHMEWLVPTPTERSWKRRPALTSTSCRPRSEQRWPNTLTIPSA